MPVRVLVVGNDLHVHKLIVDILEITFSDITIDKVTNTEGMLNKFKTNRYNYNLVILDCRSGRKADEDIILGIRKKYPHIIDHLIVLIDSLEGKPSDEVLLSIPYIIKPFSLDEFGELVKKAVSNKSQ